MSYLMAIHSLLVLIWNKENEWQYTKNVNPKHCNVLMRNVEKKLQEVCKKTNKYCDRQVFNRTSYSLWKGIVVQLSNGLSTFSWNFMDLFLILISIALTDQFRQLNNRIYSIREKVSNTFYKIVSSHWSWNYLGIQFIIPGSNSILILKREITSLLLKSWCVTIKISYVRYFLSEFRYIVVDDDMRHVSSTRCDCVLSSSATKFL